MTKVISLNHAIFAARVLVEGVGEQPAVRWAMTQLMSIPNPPPGLAFRLVEIDRTLVQRYADYEKLVRESAKGKAKKDDQGEYVIVDGKFTFTPEGQRAHEEFCQGLNEQEFAILPLCKADLLPLKEFPPASVLVGLGALLVLDDPALPTP